MDRTFEEERLAALRTLIVSMDEAIQAITEEGAQMYKLDTGQTVQTVNKFNIQEVINKRDSLMNDYTIRYNRLNGCGVSILRPLA